MAVSAMADNAPARFLTALLLIVACGLALLARRMTNWPRYALGIVASVIAVAGIVVGVSGWPNSEEDGSGNALTEAVPPPEIITAAAPDEGPEESIGVETPAESMPGEVTIGLAAEEFTIEAGGTHTFLDGAVVVGAPNVFSNWSQIRATTNVEECPKQNMDAGQSSVLEAESEGIRFWARVTVLDIATNTAVAVRVEEDTVWDLVVGRC
ncbi:hypothetical protein [Aquipuribacter sp. SD81]|uniref:hypothetical protein n=1 Tax=Aquipuribacter sp. SD81 TaxID=3127703 RepID=UPI003019637F